MRDQAYAWLDGIADDPMAVPFTVAGTTDNDCMEPGQVVWRTVEGTFEGPLFLTGDLAGDTVPVMNLDADGVPVQNGVTQANFTISIPCAALDPMAETFPLLLGHGLFQTGEIFTDFVPPIAGSVVPWNAVAGGTDWRRLSLQDLGWVGTRIIGTEETGSQLHNFAAFPARLRQGMLNTLVLARLMKLGIFNRDPAFQTPGDVGVFPGPGSHIFYFGASLGGIMGTYLAALTPDIERFALDVPAVNFSCLLQRASPFHPFDALLAAIGITIRSKPRSASSSRTSSGRAPSR